MPTHAHPTLYTKLLYTKSETLSRNMYIQTHTQRHRHDAHAIHGTYNIKQNYE